MAMQRLPNGQWSIEPRRRDFYGMVHQLLPLGLGAIETPDNIQVDGQADFLEHAIAAVVDNAVGSGGETKVNFVIQPDRNLFSAPVFVGALGTGTFPRWYATPQLIQRAQTYSMFATDRHAVPIATNVRILHIGQKVYDNPFESAKAYNTVLPYDFVANFTANDGGNGPVPAGGTLIFPLNVFADADFDVYKVEILADGDCTIQVETSGKSLVWFNRPCHIALLGGSNLAAGIPSGAWPFRLPSPSRVPASGSIVTTIADLSGAVNRVQVVYHGIRMKPPGGLPVDPRLLVGAHSVA